MLYSPSSGGVGKDQGVSGFLFGLFIYFTFDFFIHLSGRIPFYGALHPSLLITMIIAFMLYGQRDKFRGYSDAAEFRAIKILILFIILSLPFVTWPGSVLRENIPEFIKAVSFFFFSALIIDSDKRLKTFLAVFIVCQVFRVLEPLYMHVADGYWGSATHVGGGEFAYRLSGAPADVINPNELGFVIVTMVPFLYYLLWGGSSKVGKLLFISLAPALIYTLVLTMSRSGILALGVVLWMIFKEARNKFVLVAAVVLAAIVMWSQMTDIQKTRYLSLVKSDTTQSGTVQGRIDGIWKEFALGLHRPVFGHGVGTTPEVKTHLIGKSRASHNLYAELMIEIGIPGMIIFLSYLVAIYHSFRRNREIMLSVGAEHRRAFAFRLNQALVAVFWMYVFFSITYWGLSVYYWYLFGGLTLAFSRIYFSKEEPVAKPSLNKSLSRRAFG
jgi:O-antigen ligase